MYRTAKARRRDPRAECPSAWNAPAVPVIPGLASARAKLLTSKIQQLESVD